MTPYYDRDGITIYHGDCLEVMKQFPDKSFDLCLTDPPYGINANTDYFSSRANSQKIRGDKRHAWHGKRHPPIHGDNHPFNPLPLLRLTNKFALFGANNYASKLPDSYSWMVWDKKTEAIPSNSFSDGELIYCYGADFQSLRIMRHLWNGYQRATEIGEHYHPSQKPIAVIQNIIAHFSKVQTILDPFMGSGTTLVAAKKLGRRAVGIEISEKYCEIAVRRIEAIPPNLPFGEEV